MNKLFTAQLIACLFLWGCVINNIFVFNYKTVDPVLQPYVNDYIELLDKGCPSKKTDKPKFYTIQFETGEESWIGVCQYKANGFRLYIDPDWWKSNKSEEDRRQLLYHELAHCFIGKDHVKDKNNYMNSNRYYIPYEVYIQQVKADIQKFCDK